MTIPQLSLPLSSAPPTNTHPATEVRDQVFGFGRWRAGQIEAVDAFMDGQDVMVLLPTGGGKSACFQIPAVVQWRAGNGLTLVVSPLIALMDDQVQALTAREVLAVALHSGQDTSTRKEALQDRHQAALVYVSPERLATSGFRRWLARQKVAGLVVDEAHCISEWGHDFRPKYREIGQIRSIIEESNGRTPVMAVTATATPRVMDEIAQELHLRQPKRVVGELYRHNLSFQVEHIQGDNARLARVASLIKAAPEGRVVVYAATRNRAKAVSDGLRRLGLSASYYHAGRTAGARENAAKAFSEGRRPILVATSAFGMGIDQPDVRLVVHIQATGTLEAYFQEAGRAGRDGRHARCVMLYAHSDAVTQARLRGRSPPPGAEAGWRALQDYAFGSICRQSAFERYFLHVDGSDCGVCDLCLDRAGVMEQVKEARAVSDDRRRHRQAKANKEAAVDLTEAILDDIVGFVSGLKRPVSKRMVALGLRGSRAKPVKRKGLASNPAFGRHKSVPESVLIRGVEHLLHEGRLAPRGKKYPTVWIPEKRIRSAQRAGPRAPAASGLKRALVNFRKREARRKKWKTYQIFNNATLDGIVLERPSTLAELEAVSGMGPRRVHRWGVAIIELVGMHPAS